MNSFSEKTDSCIDCEFQDNLRLLRNVNFFSQLPLETIKVFAYLFVRESFKTDDFLFQQHEDIGQGFYIVSGKAVLIHTTGSREITVREYGEGEFLGGFSLLGKMSQLYSLKALTDTTCLIMSREKFRVAIEKFPELKLKVIQAMVDRVRAWEEQFLREHANNGEDCFKNLGVSLV